MLCTVVLESIETVFHMPFQAIEFQLQQEMYHRMHGDIGETAVNSSHIKVPMASDCAKHPDVKANKKY